MMPPQAAAEIRWLLRPLGDAPFLRLYLEPVNCRLPMRLFEQAFWSLPSDALHPDDARRRVWGALQGHLPDFVHPYEWFTAVLRVLLAQHEAAEILNEARSFGLPELFELEIAQPLTNYHETHCHLGGSVPYLAMWLGWLHDQRRRAVLRKKSLCDGPWRRTYAELMQEAGVLRSGARSLVSRATQPPTVEEEARLLRALGRALAPPRLASSADLRAAVGYLAICATLRREVLYQRGQTGLAPFCDAYEGYRKLQKPPGELAALKADRDNLCAALQRFVDEGATAVELRPTLDATPYRLRRKLRNLVYGYLEFCSGQGSGAQTILLGLVPSLFKQEKARSYAEQSELWCQQVRMLVAALDDDPVLRWFVVGLDAAGQELGCPPAALQGAFRLVRDYNRRHCVPRRPGRWCSRDFVSGLRGCEPKDMLGIFSAQLPPVRLGLTTHAGEDFDDPVTGLRHIFESIELLDLQPGDRLGHALVLGLDAEAAFKLLLTRARGSRRHQVRKIDGSESVQVCMPRGTHLLDLVWEQHLQRETGDVTAAHRLACVLPGAPGVPPRWDCGLLLASQTGLQIHIPGVRYRKLEEEVSAHHYEWVLIDEAWKIRYQRLREHVLRKVRCCELVIESCPTSNCTVANLSEAPLKALLQVSPPLRVTVATDDPGLLDAYPAVELERHLKDSRLRQRVLDEGRRASFIYGED